jgi:hyperosmotically inducible periplasmic protein
MNQRLLTLTSIAAVVASLAMAGCSERNQADARSAADTTVGQVKASSRDLAKGTSNGLDKAKVAANDMAQDAKDEVADAVITISVKAELARDSSLNALKVNVDTDSGRVALRGTAPSSEAREHAAALAQGIKGVVGVDNELTVEPTIN